MKKYTIHYDYYATYDVEVLAESKEEAINKAREIEVPYEEYDFSINEESVIDTKDVPDLPTLIKEAEEILKSAEAFELSPWLNVTVPVWDGEKMKPITELLENVFWDEEREEIGLETDRCSEITISDIPDIQQLNLCQAIIAQAEKNGL